MSNSALEDWLHLWFPVCGIHDLAPRQVFETELLGEELVVWRGTSGRANIWKNRCPHRGVRLTIGANLGAELRCAYHGYRFAQESGQCTSIPALPDRAPPQRICATVYPAVERDGLVWTRLAAGDPASEAPPGAHAGLALYAVAVKSPAAAVAMQLASYRFRPCMALALPEHASEGCETARMDAFRFRSVATRDALVTEVHLSIQPVDAHSSVIHGVILESPAEPLRLATLRHHARRMTDLRDRCERPP